MKFDTFASTLEEKRGLWDNMHARRKAGKPKRKPGDKNYPKTLDLNDTTTASIPNPAQTQSAVHQRNQVPR